MQIVSITLQIQPLRDILHNTYSQLIHKYSKEKMRDAAL